MQWLQLLLLKPPSKLSSEVEKTCVLTAQYQMMCSLLKELVSVPGPALPLSVRGLRSHRLVVGVASAHSIVILKVNAQTQSPQLAHSHALISVDLLMSNSKNSEPGCVWSQRILWLNSSTFLHHLWVTVCTKHSREQASHSPPVIGYLWPGLWGFSETNVSNLL